MKKLRGKRSQVKFYSYSEAERERWREEAQRRGWTMTHLIRTAVNRLVSELDARTEKAVGQ